MVRNIEESTSVVQVRRHNANGTFTTTNFNHNAVSARRDDSTPTLPVEGNFVTATDYWAVRFMSTAEPFDGKFLTNSLLSTFRVEGLATVALLSPVLDKGYGVTTINRYPLLPTSAYSNLSATFANRSRNGNWDLGQSLAELPETIGFIRDALETLLALLKALKNPDWRYVRKVTQEIILADGTRLKPYQRWQGVTSKNPIKRWKHHRSVNRDRYATVFEKGPSRKALRKAHAKGLASSWLAYQFAFLPLMSDVYSACEFLRQKLASPDVLEIRAEVPVSPFDQPSVNNSAGLRLRWESKRALKGKITYKCSSSWLTRLDGLSLLDPLKIAWELLPLSFVVDWLLPIGRFLDTLTRPWGLTFEQGWLTSYHRYTLVAEFLPPGYVKMVSGSKPTTSARMTSFHRERYIMSPISTPYFRGLDNLGYGKITSAIALIVQRT